MKSSSSRNRTSTAFPSVLKCQQFLTSILCPLTKGRSSPRSDLICLSSARSIFIIVSAASYGCTTTKVAKGVLSRKRNFGGPLKMPYSPLQGRLPGLPSQNRLGSPPETHPGAPGGVRGGLLKIGLPQAGPEVALGPRLCLGLPEVALGDGGNAGMHVGWARLRRGITCDSLGGPGGGELSHSRQVSLPKSSHCKKTFLYL